MSGGLVSHGFSFRGHYRTQSRRAAIRSTLRGSWHDADAALAAAVNRALASHPLRSPGRSISLRTALVTERSGTFDHCPDVLYKQELFAPEAGTTSFPSHLLDLPKALQRWRSIEQTLPQLWGSDAEQIRWAVAEPRAAICREYYAHEAGHLIGVDVDRKTDSGHFRPDGRACWPLIYLEEVRADLHALALAADTFEPAQAVAVLLYHVATRFGMHRLGRSSDQAPFGLVPYLLFRVMRELDLLDVARVDDMQGFTLKSSRAQTMVAGMQACGRWASEHVTIPELDAESPLDRALVGASVVRAALDSRDAALFARATGWPATE